MSSPPSLHPSRRRRKLHRQSLRHGWRPGQTQRRKLRHRSRHHRARPGQVRRSEPRRRCSARWSSRGLRRNKHPHRVSPPARPRRLRGRPHNCSARPALIFRTPPARFARALRCSDRLCPGKRMRPCQAARWRLAPGFSEACPSRGMQWHSLRGAFRPLTSSGRRWNRSSKRWGLRLRRCEEGLRFLVPRSPHPVELRRPRLALRRKT